MKTKILFFWIFTLFALFLVGCSTEKFKKIGSNDSFSLFFTSFFEAIAGIFSPSNVKSEKKILLKQIMLNECEKNKGSL